MRLIDNRTGQPAEVTLEQAEQYLVAGTHRLPDGARIPVAVRGPRGGWIRGTATDEQLRRMVRDGVGRVRTPELHRQIQAQIDERERARVRRETGIEGWPSAFAEYALDALTVNPVARPVLEAMAASRGLSEGQAAHQSARESLGLTYDGRDVLRDVRAAVTGEEGEAGDVLAGTVAAATRGIPGVSDLIGVAPDEEQGRAFAQATRDIELEQELDPEGAAWGRVLGMALPALVGPVGPAGTARGALARSLNVGERGALRAALGGLGETAGAGAGAMAGRALRSRLTGMVERGQISRATADAIAVSAGSAVHGAIAAEHAYITEQRLDDRPYTAERVLADGGAAAALGGLLGGAGGAVSRLFFRPGTAGGTLAREAPEAFRGLDASDPLRQLREILQRSAQEAGVDEGAYAQLFRTRDLTVQDVPDGADWAERILRWSAGFSGAHPGEDLRKLGNLEFLTGATRADQVLDELVPVGHRAIMDLRAARGEVARLLREVPVGNTIRGMPADWATPAARTTAHAWAQDAGAFLARVSQLPDLTTAARTAVRNSLAAMRRARLLDIIGADGAVIVAPAFEAGSHPGLAAYGLTRARRAMVNAAENLKSGPQEAGLAEALRHVAGVPGGNPRGLNLFGPGVAPPRGLTEMLHDRAIFGEGAEVMSRIDDALVDHATRDAGLVRILGGIGAEGGPRQILASKIAQALKSDKVEAAQELVDALEAYARSASEDTALLAAARLSDSPEVAKAAANLSRTMEASQASAETWTIARNHVMAKRTLSRELTSILRNQSFRPEIAALAVGGGLFGGGLGAVAGVGIGVGVAVLRSPVSAIQRITKIRSATSGWSERLTRFRRAVSRRVGGAAAGLPGVGAPPIVAQIMSDDVAKRDEALFAIAEWAERGETDPGLVVDGFEAAAFGVRQTDEELADAMIAGMARARAVVLSAIPPTVRDPATGTVRFVGAAAKIPALRDALIAVLAPGDLFAKVLDGSITTGQVMAFAAAYPELHQEMLLAAMEGAAESKDPLSMTLSVGISRLAGFPVGQAARLPAAAVQIASQVVGGGVDVRGPTQRVTGGGRTVTARQQRRPSALSRQSRSGRAASLTQRLETNL